MIIRTKLYSQSSQKKKLSIQNSKSKFSIVNINVQRQTQKRKRDFNFKSTCQQDRQVIEASSKSQNKKLPILDKQNYHQRLPRSKSIMELDSKQKNSHSKGSKLQKQVTMKNSSAINFQLLEVGPYTNNQKQLMLQSKKATSNNRIRIQSMSKSQKVAEFNHKKSQEDKLNHKKSQEDETHSSEYQEHNTRISRKPYFAQTKYLPSNGGQLQCIGQIQQIEFKYSKNIHSSQISQISKCENFQINSNVLAVLIAPSNWKVGKVDVQVQTIQAEKELFQYLKYKRRKQQFQCQLQRQFSQLQTIKNDRQIYKERIQNFNSSKKGPQNQRQKRIFNLREQMVRLQKNIQRTIIQKCKSFEVFTREIQNLQDQLTEQSHKFKVQFQKYYQIIRVALQQNPQDKILRVSERLHIITQNFLNQVAQRIRSQVKKAKPYKSQATELGQTFNEYKRSVQEYKGLLKNCFNHIQKIPQLCYGLCGNVLPDVSVKSQLRNSKNQFQMPKCMECFNSQWKFNMIIQKNILMESVLKVSEQLFK